MQLRFKYTLAVAAVVLVAALLTSNFDQETDFRPLTPAEPLAIETKPAAPETEASVVEDIEQKPPVSNTASAHKTESASSTDDSLELSAQLKKTGAETRVASMPQFHIMTDIPIAGSYTVPASQINNQTEQ